MFQDEEDITNAVHRVNTEADVVWVDGHSDYGHAFGVFWENFGSEINSKSTVMFLGDARNNYHATNAWVIKETAKKHGRSSGSTPNLNRIGIPEIRLSPNMQLIPTAFSNVGIYGSLKDS